VKREGKKKENYSKEPKVPLMKRRSAGSRGGTFRPAIRLGEGVKETESLLDPQMWACGLREKLGSSFLRKEWEKEGETEGSKKEPDKKSPALEARCFNWEEA